MKKIVLLDLNYTLAESISLNINNWTYDVSKDKYSLDLSNELKNMENVEIHLVTARPEEYEEETIKKIWNDTELSLSYVMFKPEKYRYVKVEKFKRDYVRLLIKKGYNVEDMIAIESNKNTRSEYKKLGISEIYTRNQFLDERTAGGILF